MEIEQKEATIPIETQGNFKNISLKQKWEEGTQVRPGLGDGEYIIVEKDTYNEGREVVTQYGKSFSCGVKYNDESVSFWLTPEEHEKYVSVAGIGDKVKILNLKETFTFKGAEKKKNVLHFSKVE